MHRTQLLLESWQYEALKLRARREGKSLSGWVRGKLESLLSPQAASLKAKQGKGLWAICGLAGDPGGPSGKDHDSVLYSWSRKK